MRIVVAVAVVLFAAASAFAQQQPAADVPQLKTRTEVPATASEPQPQQAAKAPWIVPAGSKIPVQLKQAISTKNARPGDPIYAQTTFPVIVNGQVMIPGGTFVQGVVDSVKRAGRIKGTSSLQFHLTTLLYPNGYVLDMAAAVDQVPGDESSHMKEPGTLQHDSEKGKDVERIGRGAAEGAAIGGMAGAVSGTTRGVGVGGLSGIAAGSLIAMLARGSDLRFEAGTVVDVSLNHAIALDPEKIMRPSAIPAYYATPQQQFPTTTVVRQP
jgi:hypothetical protein